MKYIIDVPDGTKWIEAYYTVDHFQYQGQAIIVDSLIPYTEPDLSPLVDEAVEAIEDEVWEFIDFLTGMSPQERYECFDKVFSHIIVSTMSYQEAKAKYETWLKQKDEIHVGDEVAFEMAFGNGLDNNMKAVALDQAATGEEWCVLTENGCIETHDEEDLYKTGRHFNEVGQMLEKMRGGEE